MGKKKSKPKNKKRVLHAVSKKARQAATPQPQTITFDVRDMVDIETAVKAADPTGRLLERTPKILAVCGQVIAKAKEAFLAAQAKEAEKKGEDTK